MPSNILLLDGSQVNVARSDAGMVTLTGDKVKPDTCSNWRHAQTGDKFCLTTRKAAEHRHPAAHARSPSTQPSPIDIHLPEHRS